MNLLKKLVMLSALMLLTTTAASAEVVEFTIGDTNFVSEKDGAIIQNVLEAAPFISDGRTMVPVRAISDAFGADTGWDPEKCEVKITSADKEILLTIENPLVIVNGTEKKLDAAPVIVNGRTFVPLRFVSEELLYNVNYVNSTKQVVIDNTDIVVKCGDETISLSEVKALYQIMYDLAHGDVDAGNVSEEDFSFYIAQATLEMFSNYAKIYNAFPTVSFSEEDCEAIIAGIESEKEQITPQLKGLVALIYERQYFSNGNNILRTIAEETDFDEIYYGEFISAKHILVEDEKLANDIYKKLSDGADFDELVGEYNQDPGMEQNPDGYVFGRGYMVKEFEDASYALKIDEISKPVKSQFGYHIIKRVALPDITESVKQEMVLDYANEILDNSQDAEILVNEEELLKLIK